ncbi:hypothetical protein [Caldimonas brevitalea]|uniref:hypothetical protein n=1 Tax=Caldimonas brevitalea TaxID=413882 RepID=UPI001EEDA6CA|nr:hypothetical protein [Caldimonas brevitalea]
MKHRRPHHQGQVATASSRLAVAVVMWLGATASFADTAPPIRVVRVGHGNVEGLKNIISVSHDACRAAKGLPPAPAPLPPDRVLAKLVLFEQEELFDGPLWAEYKLVRTVGADPRHDCQIVVFNQRTAVIERTCKSRIGAFSELLLNLTDKSAPPIRPPHISEEKLSDLACQSKKPAADMDPSGLATADASGTPCVWNSALHARASGGKAVGNQPDKSSLDSCLYAKRPSYDSNGLQRPVVLATAKPTQALLESLYGDVVATWNTKLQAFSDGVPIPSYKFTRASAEAFAKQPTTTPLQGHR